MSIRFIRFISFIRFNRKAVALWVVAASFFMAAFMGDPATARASWWQEGYGGPHGTIGPVFGFRYYLKKFKHKRTVQGSSTTSKMKLGPMIGFGADFATEYFSIPIVFYLKSGNTTGAQGLAAKADVYQLHINPRGKFQFETPLKWLRPVVTAGFVFDVSWLSPDGGGNANLIQLGNSLGLDLNIGVAKWMAVTVTPFSGEVMWMHRYRFGDSDRTKLDLGFAMSHRLGVDFHI